MSTLNENAVENGGECAFTRPTTALPNGDHDWGATGLTKREYIATHVMAGLAAFISPPDVAGMAVRYADALLAALEGAT